MTDKTKKYIKNILKLCISVGALAFVFSKIDIAQTWQVIRQASLGWLVLALLVYVVSQLVSSERVRGMVCGIGIPLPGMQNLRLYWLGMFYNFFLPGGIGGDGYKVYWLHKRYRADTKSLAFALLGDRLSGLVAIASYTVVYFSLRRGLAFKLGLPEWFSPYYSLVLIPIGFVAYWLIFRVFVPRLCRPAFRAAFISFLVQGLQMTSAAIILVALGHGGREAVGDYLFLFLLSSIASAVPVTLGGAGAREATFFFGSSALDTSPDVAVSLSLLFYLVSLISSLPGITYAVHNDLIDGHQIPQPEVTPTIAEALEEAEADEPVK